MNNELHIGGNSYGPNAVGSRARAEQRNVTIGAVQDDRLGAAMTALRSSVDRHREEIPQADRVIRDLDAVDRDLRAADPDPEGLRDTVKRIVGRVAMVGTVLAAANDLKDIVESILPA